MFMIFFSFSFMKGLVLFVNLLVNHSIFDVVVKYFQYAFYLAKFTR